MLKAAIFDLDGTLLDTSRDICRILNQSLAHFGLPEVSLKDTIKMVGDGAYKLVERAVPCDKKEIVRDVYEYYEPVFAACDNSLTCLYEGEDAALSALKTAGVKLAVLTNKTQKAADAVCASKLGKYSFDIVLGQTEKFPLKPDPASALYIMEKFSVSPSECVFVGDGETDVRTAKAAGMLCVSALWGFREQAKLEEAGADVFAENFTRFLQILQEKFSFRA